MAIVKHIKSRNANYSAAINYLLFEHDEKTGKKIVDESGRSILRKEFYMDGLNCDPMSFDKECELTNAHFHKNKKREDIKSHHYIISYDPADVTENGLTGERAQAISLDLAKQMFPRYQALVVTHTDGHNESGNIHTHIVINSVRKTAEGDFEVWDSINTTLNPEMKEKVLNQSIFLYTCPSCGKTFRLDYSTLYHQMEDLIMIYMVSESEVEKTYEMFYGENALFDFRTEKYLAQIVTSPNQLVEKIQIFDAGKDDRIMELVKLLVTDSLHENNPDKEFDELRFAVDNDGTNILVIINKGEITGAVDIDNMYEFASSHCNDFKDLCDDEDIVINREWILNKLAEEEN